MSMQFREMSLSPEILKAIDEMGFEEPTQVQGQVIPLMLAGQDVIAQARTGTGKTAAFGIPIIERITADQSRPQALVLAPTRELAVQVAGEIGRIAQFCPIRVVPVYGGQPIERQLRALRQGAHVVIGTPGRVMDHLRRGSLELREIRTVVLDEADEMLDLGFLDDVETILRETPRARQTALFSATMPMAILRLTDRYMRDPERIQLARPRGLTVPQTNQRYYLVPSERMKFEALCQVLDLVEPQAAIIFCATKRGVDDLAVALKGRGYDAEPIHGDLNQAQRDKVIRAFREHRTELLIATDVAARRLDIEGLSHVINYDMPQDTERYVHRIGRTGRIGAAGEAITLVTPWEVAEIEEIAAQTESRIEAAVLPEPTEETEPVDPHEVLARQVLEAIRQGSAKPFRAVIERLAADHDPIDLAAGALALARLGDTEAERIRDTAPDRAGSDRVRRSRSEAERAPRSGAAERGPGSPRRDRADAPGRPAGPPPARSRSSGQRPTKSPAVRISNAGNDLAAFSKALRPGRRRR